MKKEIDNDEDDEDDGGGEGETCMARMKANNEKRNRQR
jgi:hypothetical protein